MRKALIVLMMILIAGVGSGCAKKAPSDGKVVAQIGDYELTKKDFDDEARLLSFNEDMQEDPYRAKEELLDHIIMKKVLIQEAQRQNFDKDKAFMKEIERYWEQALIKLLVNKKTEELSKSITIDDNEIRNEYDVLSTQSPSSVGSYEEEYDDVKEYLFNKKLKERFDKWLEKERSDADVTTYKGNL